MLIFSPFCFVQSHSFTRDDTPPPPPPLYHFGNVHDIGDSGSRSLYFCITVGICSVNVGAVLLYIWLRWRRVGHAGAGLAVLDLELAPPSVPPHAHGLGLAAIGAFPMVAYPPPARRSGEVPDSACPICLEDFSTGVEIRVLPCHHYYHPTCIEAALLLRPTCPYCGQSLTAVDKGWSFSQSVIVAKKEKKFVCVSSGDI
ncbi:RING-H2 finger protein ATL66-like protein [Carex littledalei]|uniref:RING-H2 finger protein ATL66-like protein n=1 Tax=Carex littledalei TaxID=544730 RepID=A0A833R5T8_9POAL|nr:RING-H2 finger protein ATL66-like protein [Carex littledalei]